MVDDGSSDGTLSTIQSYGSAVRAIHQSNQGLSAARNRAVAESRGNWLAFLDADDFWLPAGIEKVLGWLKGPATGFDILTCGWRYVDCFGNPEGPPVFPSSATYCIKDVLLGNRFPPAAAFARRKAVLEAGSFSDDIYGVQDWDLWLRMVASGRMIGCIPQVAVAYRQLPNSMSRNVPRMRDNGLAVLDRFYSQPAVPPAALDMKDLAYGLVRTYAGANFIAAGERNRGVEEFSHALRQHPALLRAPETYYAIACAQQPLAWKGTGRHLDLGEAEALLQAVLTRAFMSSESSDQRAQKEALAQAYRVLGRLALLQGRARQALTFSTRSLLHARSSSAARELARTCFKVVH